MTQTATTPRADEFRVGRVFGRAFELLSRDVAKFLLLGGIAWSPFLAWTLLGIDDFGPGDSTLTVVVGLGGLFLLLLALQQLTQTVLLYGVFQAMRGQSFAVAESLTRGLARLLPILGLFILMGLGMILAGILLIVPLFIVLSMWYVALPACIIEQQGPTGSLRRSAELTKGHRWKIFAIYLVIGAASSLVQNVVELVVGPGGPVFSLIGAFAVLASFSVFQAISIAVIYHDLRVAKEGFDIGRVAAVFD